jgi:hypothetical protein
METQAYTALSPAKTFDILKVVFTAAKARSKRTSKRSMKDRNLICFPRCLRSELSGG